MAGLGGKKRGAADSAETSSARLGGKAYAAEKVIGFCTKEEYSRFLHHCPIFERLFR